MLQAQSKRSWHDIVTLDESRFYPNTDHEQIWLALGEAASDRERHMIQSPKLILTFVWGVTGFHVIRLLAKGSTFDAMYYIDEILSEIAIWRDAQGGGTNQKLIVHIDNTRPHTARSTLRYIEFCGIV
jgi:hypothetical protein